MVTCWFIKWALFEVVLFGSVSTQECPDGWVEWRNTCFFLSSPTDTRHSANSSCHEMDSHLAVIEDDEENLFLTKLMNRHSVLDAWIGLWKTKDDVDQCHKIDCAGQKWTWLGDVSIDSASMDPMWEEYGPS
uniref:C-type lectin domain-containing protein n=1 Tax=Capitella teleta TaxID=283909 RepID=X1ZL51_CAPTE